MSSPQPDARTTLQVAEALHASAIRLLRRLRKSDAATGLSGPQASALSILTFQGDVTLGRLAALEEVRPPSMSKTVKELEAAGLVERSPDPADARSARISATAEGRNVLEEARGRRLARLVAALEARSPPERRLLADAVGLLREIADSDLLD